MNSRSNKAFNMCAAIGLAVVLSGCSTPKTAGVGSSHLWTPVDEWASLAEAEQNQPDEAASWSNVLNLPVPARLDLYAGENGDTASFGYSAPLSVEQGEGNRSYLARYRRSLRHEVHVLSDDLFTSTSPMPTYTIHESISVPPSYPRGSDVYLISTRYTIDP